MKGEQKIYWGVGIASVAAMLWALISPPPAPQPDEFPWHISHTAAGNTRVLGLTLGISTTGDAEQRFREAAELGIFRANDGRLGAEAYFEQVSLAGLKSRVVATINVHGEEILDMAKRGSRMSATASGKKITPRPEDVPRLKQLPLNSLTLIPSIRVPGDLLVKRFGNPDRIELEPGSGGEHWLYPKHALDIAIGKGTNEKQVFQYVSPRDFDLLTQPLAASPNATSR